MVLFMAIYYWVSQFEHKRFAQLGSKMVCLEFFICFMFPRWWWWWIEDFFEYIITNCLERDRWKDDFANLTCISFQSGDTYGIIELGMWIFRIIFAVSNPNLLSLLLNHNLLHYYCFKSILAMFFYLDLWNDLHTIFI